MTTLADIVETFFTVALVIHTCVDTTFCLCPHGVCLCLSYKADLIEFSRAEKVAASPYGDS